MSPEDADLAGADKSSDHHRSDNQESRGGPKPLFHQFIMIHFTAASNTDKRSRIVGQNSQVTVLRKVAFQKTDAEKNTVTTWSPLDLADVNGDGQIEVILEGDIEVIGTKDGSIRTIFSGLGYYL